MRSFWLLTAALIALFLAVFGLAYAFGWTVLVDEGVCRQFLLGKGRVMAGLIGVALLVGDVVLPVASSAVMFVHGRLFGVMTGALLSLAGGVGAAWLGWTLGRAGAGWLSGEDRSAARALVGQWGMLAVVVTRPIPILAESVAITAGAAGMGRGRLLTGSLLGNVPPAVVYGWAGAYATDWSTGIVVFLLVLTAAGLCWWVGQRARKSARAAV